MIPLILLVLTLESDLKGYGVYPLIVLSIPHAKGSVIKINPIFGYLSFSLEEYCLIQCSSTLSLPYDFLVESGPDAPQMFSIVLPPGKQVLSLTLNSG
jgi:hypothetical protein